ncbi:small integral membrane protein 20 [Nilaparvata lugens]|uniref:small integral membrane protein 20 n=1 Tax=Nilaparvata lugens TaxID=108931 RepID=UPI00193D13C7|nr:small integral membrane protein 20 [Nilaparvata lugens]
MKKLQGWRFAGFVGGMLGVLGLALYPIMIYPMYNTDEYKKLQAIGRKNINQEDIQPGGMRIWSDPFGRK